MGRKYKDIEITKVRTMRKSKLRTVAERERDLALAAELYLKGKTYKEIAAEINAVNAQNGSKYRLTDRNINADIRTIHSRWTQSYLVDFDSAKAKELAHIDKLEQQYWNAWERSILSEEEVYTEQIKDLQGKVLNSLVPNVKGSGHQYNRNRVAKKVKNRDGNPSFLQGVQWCIEQRCKILGISQSIQNINVNWKKEAQAAGVDPDAVVDDLAQQFVAAAMRRPSKDDKQQ